MVTIALAISYAPWMAAQTSAPRPPPKSSQARQEELAKVQEMLSDPDPNARLANMEDIVNSGDPTRLQLALRIVFHSDDQNMRALGVRAYIATLHEITFEIQLPAQTQRQYDEAQGDEDKMNLLLKQYPYLNVFASIGFRIRVIFSKYDITKSGGVLIDPSAPKFDGPGEFTISGDRVSGTVFVRWGGFGDTLCSLDFRPTTDMHLKGAFSCGASVTNRIMVPRLSISAPIF